MEADTGTMKEIRNYFFGTLMFLSTWPHSSSAFINKPLQPHPSNSSVSAQVPRQQYPPPREVVQAAWWTDALLQQVFCRLAGFCWVALVGPLCSFLGLHGKPRYPDDCLQRSRVGQPAPWFCLEETTGCSMSIASLHVLGEEKRTWFHAG